MDNLLERGDIFFLPKTINSVTGKLARYYSESKITKFTEKVEEQLIFLDQIYEFNPIKIADKAIDQAIDIMRETLSMDATDETLREEIYNAISQYLPFRDSKVFDAKDLYWFYEVTDVYERNPSRIISMGMSDRNPKRKKVDLETKQIEFPLVEDKSIVDTTVFPQTEYIEIPGLIIHPASKRQSGLFDKSMLRPHHLVTARRLKTEEVPKNLLKKLENSQDPNPDCVVQQIKFYQEGRTLGRVRPDLIEIFQTSK